MRSTRTGAAWRTWSYPQWDRSRLENMVVSAVEKYDSKDFKGASEILGKVIAEDPGNDAAHYYLGLSAFCVNDMATAEAELEKASRLDTMNFWYRYRLAMLYSATDRKELTIAMYEKLLKDFPKKNELYYNLVDLYLADNQFDKALETLSQIEAVFGSSGRHTRVSRSTIKNIPLLRCCLYWGITRCQNTMTR